MGMMTKPQAMEDALDAAAREAEKEVFIKPFRPAIPATLDALLQVNSSIERTLGWVIEGWLIDDLVPHFGRAKIGKSTGIAGQIACIASIDTDTGKRAHHWCGHRVNRHGLVLYYSGEETKHEIATRMERTFHKMGYRGADLDTVMRRVVPVCPKSWTAEQYAGLNPFICAKMPVAGVGIRHEQYQATATLEWLYEIVDNHNAAVDARGGADDEKIIGIVFDSMTSVAGFSSTDEEGIPNLLFDLGRSAQRRGLFVILVAHSPQSATVDPLRPDWNAIDRLKGNGAWSAICRLMIEWRLPGGRAKDKNEKWHEAKGLFDQEVASINDEIVVAVVADGNVAFSKQKMWFKRDGDGGHVDLSRFMVNEPRGFTAARWNAKQIEAEAQGVAAAAAGLIDIDRRPAREAVLAMIVEAMEANENEAREKQEKLAKVPTGKQVMAVHKAWQKDKERRERWPVLTRDPRNGGISERTGGDHSIRYLINQLVAAGEVAEVVGGVVPLDRVTQGYRLKNDVVESSAPAPVIDLEPVFDAVLDVIEDMDRAFEHAGEKAHEVPVNPQNIQAALLSTAAMEKHPVLRTAFEDGRLIHNGPAPRAPLAQSPAWYAAQLTNPDRGRLVRLKDGTYARPVAREEKAA